MQHDPANIDLATLAAFETNGDTRTGRALRAELRRLVADRKGAASHDAFVWSAIVERDDLRRQVEAERELCDDAHRNLDAAIRTCASLRADRDRLRLMLDTADAALGRVSTLTAWAFGAVVLAFVVGAVVGALVA